MGVAWQWASRADALLHKLEFQHTGTPIRAPEQLAADVVPVPAVVLPLGQALHVLGSWAVPAPAQVPWAHGLQEAPPRPAPQMATGRVLGREDSGWGGAISEPL